MIGLIGSIISIITWKRLINSKLNQNKTAGIYLFTLAACDSGLLICFLLTDSLPTIVPSWRNGSYFYAAFYCWMIFPLFYFFTLWGNWLVVAITLHRFFIIAFPIKIRSMHTTYRSFCVVLGVTLFSALVNLPHFFVCKPKKEFEDKWVIVTTGYGASEGSKNYQFFVDCICFFSLPFIIIAFLNSAIIYKLWMHKKECFALLNDSVGRFYCYFISVA